MKLIAGQQIAEPGDPVKERGHHIDDVGRIFSVKGPKVFVDWEFVRGGKQRQESCYYFIYDLTWNNDLSAWTIPEDFLGY